MERIISSFLQDSENKRKDRGDNKRKESVSFRTSKGECFNNHYIVYERIEKLNVSGFTDVYATERIPTVRINEKVLNDETSPDDSYENSFDYFLTIIDRTLRISFLVFLDSVIKDNILPIK